MVTVPLTECLRNSYFLFRQAMRKVMEKQVCVAWRKLLPSKARVGGRLLISGDKWLYTSPAAGSSQVTPAVEPRTFLSFPIHSDVLYLGGGGRG